MASLGREKSLYYGYSNTDSSIGYPGLPEPSICQGSSGSCHVGNASYEGKTTASTTLAVPLRAHHTPPSIYPPTSRRNFTRLEPLRGEHRFTPYTSPGEESSARRRLPLWRKKKRIFWIVALINIIIIGAILGGVLASRGVILPWTSSTEKESTTKGSTSSTTTTIASSSLPVTIMSASPYRWEPNSVGTQASGNVTDSGSGQNKSDAAGKPDELSGPRHSPGGGKY